MSGLKELALNPPPPPQNFADWILASFGKGIAKHFLLPYNLKVWAYPPEMMNYRWVGDRVASVDMQRIQANIDQNRDDVSWGPNATFQFPQRGGTGEIWRRVGQRLEGKITLNKEATRVDAKKRVVHFADGGLEKYDLLFTTMPLDVLTGMLDGIDVDLAADSLHHSTVTIVGLGIRGQVPEGLKTKCWMYFPEDKAPFFRATVFSNYSRYNAPEGAWSLMTETASSRHVPFPDGDFEQLVIAGAKRTRLIPEDAKIESVWTFKAGYGYPTPSLGRDAVLERALPALAKHGIYSRGRFGAWKYEVSNQDHTFMQGVEWVNSIMKDEPELTVNDPRAVNAPKKA
jgi:protoporphyrinogen oxidase